MIPLRRAFFWIFLSTLAVSGSASFGLFYYQHYVNLRKQDPRYTIKAIVQERIEGPALSTRYLSELLDLSADRPTNLYSLHVKEAEKRLLASPHIKSAQVKKINPSILYITYASREPVALIGDFSNEAVDEEGVVMPIRPFIEAKPLPYLFLGESKDTLKLALKILKELKGHPVTHVDVSQVFALSSGKRQIVIGYGDDLLRLNKEEYLTQINAYIMLKSRIGSSKVVDLRLPQLAYIQNREG